MIDAKRYAESYVRSVLTLARLEGKANDDGLTAAERGEMRRREKIHAAIVGGYMAALRQMPTDAQTAMRAEVARHVAANLDRTQGFIVCPGVC